MQLQVFLGILLTQVCVCFQVIRVDRQITFTLGDQYLSR